MDERPTETNPDTSLSTRRRGRRLVTALAVAGILVAIPAGAALAGGSDNSSSSGGDSAGAVPAQSTTPDDRQRGDGDRDRGDCPEKDGQEGQGSAQI
jgi:hypothetical protein